MGRKGSVKESKKEAWYQKVMMIILGLIMSSLGSIAIGTFIKRCEQGPIFLVTGLVGFVLFQISVYLFQIHLAPKLCVSWFKFIGCVVKMPILKKGFTYEDVLGNFKRNEHLFKITYFCGTIIGILIGYFYIGSHLRFGA